MKRSNITKPRPSLEIIALFIALLAAPAAIRAGGVIPPFLAAAIGLEAEKDVSYVADGGRRQQLDICYATRGKARPLIVWIHGGGWESGSKDRNPALLLVAEGYAVASINYRLTDDAPWPAQIEDCKAAIRFLRANADRYRIDPDRIGVWGGSAGGHLAAMLGTAGDVQDFDTASNSEQSSRVQAVCDWFGPASFCAETLERVPMTMAVSHRRGEKMVAALLGGTPEARMDVARSASPVTYASADDPPFLIMHGDMDQLVPLEQSRLLEARLKDAGVSVRLKVVKEAGHAGREWTKRDVIKQVRSFFDRTLKS